MKLYETLNVNANSNKEEIEKAYKRLVVSVHPDRSTADVKRYLDINCAYEILRDPHKKEFYDLFGDKSLRILQSEKEGYVWSRCLNRVNLLLILIALTVLLFNIMLLPIYIYIRKTFHCYSLYIAPSMVSSLLLFLPTYRAYRLISKMVLQVLYMLVFSVNCLIIAIEMLIIGLICDKIINQYVGLSILVCLETLSICFILYKNHKLKEYEGTDNRPKFIDRGAGDEIYKALRTYLPQGFYSGSIIFSIVNFIPLYVRVILPFVAIVVAIISTSIVTQIKIFLSIPIVLFGLSFILVVCEFQNILVLLPLLLLFLLILLAFYAIATSFPTYTKKTKELDYENLIKV